ncbi:MAG: phosphoribosylformylglycinamidine synthase subunit PurQ [Planctomycetes bacterium]|nr:phosphoribosylformylglycinamidine synthase subunit PurQ [Planctomycetota bacterium]
MPHPERFIRPTHNPHWSRLKEKPASDGITIFNIAVRYIQENF